MRLVGLVAVIVAASLAAGCASTTPEPSATTDEPAVSSPFATCPTTQGGAPAPAGDVRVLPDVSLPCFTGGEMITLSRLGRPALINFWASSCGPCRKELPELQRFADAHPDLVVIGVVTADRASAAAAAGQAFGVRFPSVFDPDSRLLSRWGRSVLPVTLFVDAQGRVRHEDTSGALTLQRATELAHQYLGVPA
jgi:thiol-disulfide isomerase/thioredoxin